MPRFSSFIRECTLVCVAAVIVTISYGAVSPALTRWYKQAFVRQRPAAPELKAGDTVKLGGASLPRGPMSIILVTSPNCRFCMASRKFHSMLSREALERGISFYVAVPSVDAAQAYIRDAGIVGPSRSWSDLSFRVVSTPTLVLVDSVSTAKAILVGQLPEASETEVLRIVKDPAELDSAGFIDGQMRITAAQLSELQTRDKATLVDVRERPQYQIWHREGAINIPLLELPVRAPFELDATGLLVVDCSQVSTSSCASMMKSAAHVAPRTAALSEGLVFGSCQVSRTTETR